MKRILYLIIALCATVSYAQGDYEITIEGSIIDFRNSYCSEFSIHAILDNGDEVNIYDGAYSENRRIYINVSKKISNVNKVVRFRMYAKRHHKRNCYTPSKHQKTQFLDVSSPYTCYLIKPEQYGFGIMNGGGSSNALSETKLTFKVFPIIKIAESGIDDFLPSDKRINITATSGFPNSATTYNWQYRLQGTPNFLNMPVAHNYKSTLNISAGDIFGDVVNDHLGKQIEFRINSCDGIKLSDVRTYTIVPSAPTFIAKKDFKPSCYDNTDGSVKFTFSRPLYPNEKLAILPKDGSATFPSTADITELHFNPDTGLKDSYTIHNISSGNYTATVLGYYGLFNTYTLDPEHDMSFEITNPTIVKIDSVDVTPNWCNDGDGDPNSNNDGAIQITASGGNTGIYQYNITNSSNVSSGWINFNGGNKHLLNNVIPDVYRIQVQKSVWDGAIYCPAYDLNEAGEPLAQIKTITVTVEQPDDPLGVIIERVNQPTAFGFSDGRIRATIFGGTLIDNNHYDFKWTDEDDNVINTFNAEFDSTQSAYVVTLHSVGTGIYTITAWDKNFSSALNKIGCTVVGESISLKAPEPLVVNIETINEISCNNGNEFFNFKDSNVDDIVDQFQDGVLKVIATGGEPISEDNPYEYTWKVQESGVWRNLNKNEKIIDFLSTAHYAVNIKDKNNIVLGDYAEYSLPDGSRAYKLVQEQDSVKFLPQPEKLNITFDKINSSCAAGNDASATVNITGGTPPYTYKWNNNKTTKENDNLTSGIYFVAVQDAKGCEIEGSVNIEQPEGLMVSPIEIINPTCYGGDDGHIELKISGGTPPYSYYWDDESTALALTGLESGTYQFNVKDAIGCTTFYEVDLADPEPINIDLGSNRTICAQQTLLFDIEIQDSNATYQWGSDTGFESTKSAVELDKPGTYTATVTTGLGCVGTTSIVVTVLDTLIDADFLITTQAFIDEELILVNVSEPIGDLVEWIVPEHVKIISETDSKLVLSFDKTGPYDIQLRSHQGDCFEDLIKTVIVQPAQDVPKVDRAPGNFIKEFIIYPNPNTGTFKVKIGLAEASNINLKIINLISAETIKQYTEMNKQEFLIDYSVNLPSGVYLLWLETSRGSETRKLVIQ